MYKTNFVKDKKLVRKTTISIAILITATLIFSGAVSAIGIHGMSTTMNVNEQFENNEPDSKISKRQIPLPYELVADENIDTIPFGRATILSEGFEGGVIPPSGWTLQQTNPTYTWEIDDYDPHSGTYCASCFYDPALVPQDEWLITPSMDFTPHAGDGIFLSFWWLMSYYWGVDPYDNYDLNVKISIDGGTSWTLLWNEDTVGVFDNWMWYDTTFGTHIDLTSYSTESNVLIGFQYEGVDGAQLSLDDILIYTTGLLDHDVGVTGIISPVSGPAAEDFTPEVTVQNFGANDETDVPIHMTIHKIGGVVTTTLVEEYFEGTFPPTGWTVINNAVACQWERNDWYGRTNYAGGSGYCADADADKCGYGTTWPMDTELLSPSFSLAGGYLSAHATFIAAYNDAYGTGDYADVDVSIDGGTNWIPELHWTSDHDAYGPGEPVDINLGAYIGETNVMIRWHYYADSWDYYYEIDDVYIYGESLTLIGEYDRTEYVDINSGQTIDYTFTLDWSPYDWHVTENADIDYLVSACTELPTDEDNSNNCSSDVTTLSYPYFHDVLLKSINTPVDDGPAQTLDVEVTIKNIGQYQECCYKTNVQIGTVVESVVMFEDFEADDGGYTVTGGLWEWGTPTDPDGPTSAHSGSYCWGTDLDYGYGNYRNAKLDSVPITVPSIGKLRFWHWYDTEANYDGCEVKISNDGGSTFNLLGYYTGHGQGYWEEVEFSLSDYANQQVMLRWHFGSDSSVGGYPGWFIDDVEVIEVSLDAEYDEDICTIILDPGEEADLTFPAWTPEDLQYGVNGPIDYVIVATAMDLDDTNPANDQASDDFTLVYYHDVGVKEITSPARGGGKGDVLWDNGDTNGVNGISMLSGTGTRRSVLEDFEVDEMWTITDFHTVFVWNTLPPGSGTDFELSFWTDDGGQPGTPFVDSVTVSYNEVATGRIWFGREEARADLEIEPITLTPGIYWVEMHVVHPTDNCFLMIRDDNPIMEELWVDYEDLGGLMSSTTQFGERYDAPFNLTGTSGGVAPVEVYVPPGPSSIETIVENIGTFEETGLTCYAEIYEFISDPNGTLVYEDNETGINLNPLGGTHTCDEFDDYNFEAEGVYNLIIDFPLGNDVDTANNHKVLGIGCDASAPTSTHTLDPPTPDGLNGWYISDLTVTLDADDGTEEWQSGVKEIKYSVNGGTTQTITGAHGSFILSDDGEDIEVEYWAIDNVDNEESPHNTFTIDMDQTDPEVDAAWDSYQEGGKWYVRFTITATDAMSGMERVEMWINLGIHETITGAGPTYEFVIQWSSVFETVTFKFVAYDIAGHSDYDEILGSGITAYPYPSGSMTITQNTLKQTMPMQR